MEKHTWAAGLFVGSIGAAVAAVIAAATQTPPAFSATWFVLVTAAAGALFVVAIGLLVSALRDRPRLVFGTPVVKERFIGLHTLSDPSTSASAGGNFRLTLTTTASGYGSTNPGGLDPALHPTGSAFFAYVDVLNEPRQSRHSAKDVHANIRFVKADDTEIPMTARWADPVETQWLQPTMTAP